MSQDSKDNAHAEAAQFVPLFSQEDLLRPTHPDVERTYGHVAEIDGDDVDFFVSSVEQDKEKAYANGYEAGEKETIASIGKKLNDQITDWQARIAGLDSEAAEQLDAFFRLVEERTVSIGVGVARRILQAEVAVRPEWIAERVRGAIELYRSQASLRVLVNPNDMPFLSKLTDNIVGSEPTPGSAASPEVVFVEDNTINPGGFVVESDLARYDHTFEGQLGEMERALADLYERSDD